MRNLITKYTFIPGSRTITLPDFANLAESNPFGVENIRLIVNETQKVVVCSSMQKDNIESVEGNTITYTDSLAPLEYGDQLTIEVDMGDGIVYSGGVDWVIDAKINSIGPAEDLSFWELAYEHGRKLKPLAEGITSSSKITGKMAYLFDGSYCTSADLSSWEGVYGEGVCEGMFQKSMHLLILDAPNIKEIRGKKAMYNAFKNCNSLYRVNLGNLISMEGENLSGDNYSNGCFYGCSALVDVDMHSLQSVSGSNGFYYFFGYCSSLRKVDLRNWQYTIGSNACAFFFDGCPSLSELHIGVGAIKFNSYTNPIYAYTSYITDLYIYGPPADNIYITYLPLNFDSVLRVLQHIADPNNNAATGKTLSFKSGLNFAVTQQELDDYNAAKTTVQSTLGWTVQNAPNVHL